MLMENSGWPGRSVFISPQGLLLLVVLTGGQYKNGRSFLIRLSFVFSHNSFQKLEQEFCRQDPKAPRLPTGGSSGHIHLSQELGTNEQWSEDQGQVGVRVRRGSRQSEVQVWSASARCTRDMETKKGFLAPVQMFSLNSLTLKWSW